MNTSATGGFLVSTSPPPAEDDALEDLFQASTRAIVGLPGNLVRPRYQSDPPKTPEVGVSWIGLGVSRSVPLGRAAIVHRSAGEGQDETQQHEELTVDFALYGPNARALASRLRDGFSVSQNREALASVGIKLVEVGEVLNGADLINDRWVRRIELAIVFRREVSRLYPVLNILALTGAINDEKDAPARVLSTSES